MRILERLNFKNENNGMIVSKTMGLSNCKCHILCSIPLQSDNVFKSMIRLSGTARENDK